MTSSVWHGNPFAKKIYKAQKKIRRRLVELVEQAYYRFNLVTYERALTHKLGSVSSDYRDYLHEQLEHTLTKKRLFLKRERVRAPLIDLLVQHFGVRGRDVICVGCRDTDEIVYFRELGARKVIGIDLYAEPPDIIAMDMHKLEFPDNSFDVVYSRHSYEHAYDKRKAASEFIRVSRNGGAIVIEVPANYKGGADYNVFSGTDDLTAPFAANTGKTLHLHLSRKEENTDKMDILRMIIEVRK
jgi:SAM-dependent methyltransferase